MEKNSSFKSLYEPIKTINFDNDPLERNKLSTNVYNRKVGLLNVLIVTQ